MEIGTIFQLAFMQRAMLAGVIVSVLCALWGVFVIVRKQAFLADAVAHASLTGIAASLLLGWLPLPLAVLTGIFMALIITRLKTSSKLTDDTVIGIVYTFLFALGVMLLSLYPSYRPDLMSYLFGSLLTVSWTDIAVALIALIVSGVLIKRFYTELMFTAFDSEGAKIRGINTLLFEYIINIAISVAVIVAIKSVGIVMVSALLLIPSASAKLLSASFRHMFPISIAISLISSVTGLILSFYLNTPAGATIVITASIIFVCVYIYDKTLGHSHTRL